MKRAQLIIHMEKKNQLIQKFKSKYLLAEVLSFAFYCHKGYMLFALMCRDSRTLLADEYILRCFKKKEREFFATSLKAAETLKHGLNGTYIYTLSVMESNFFYFLDAMEESLSKNPSNLPFEVNKIQINRNNKGSEVSLPLIEGDAFATKQEQCAHIQQFAESILKYPLSLSVINEINFFNSEAFFEAFALLCEKRKKKLKIKKLQIHNAFGQYNVTEEISNESFVKLIENSFTFLNLEVLVLQRSRINVSQLESLIACLQEGKGRALWKVDISFTEENLQEGVTSAHQLRLFFEFLKGCPALLKYWFEFREQGKEEYVSQEHFNVPCNLKKLFFFRCDDVMKGILSWFLHNSEAKIEELFVTEQKKAFKPALKEIILEIIRTKKLKNLQIQYQFEGQIFEDVYKECFENVHLTQFNLLRKAGPHIIEVNKPLPLDSQLEQLRLWGKDQFSPAFLSSVVNQQKKIKRIRICERLSEPLSKLIEELKETQELEIYYCSLEGMPIIPNWFSILYLEIFNPTINSQQMMSLKALLVDSRCQLTHLSLQHFNRGHIDPALVNSFFAFLRETKNKNFKKLSIFSFLVDFEEFDPVTFAVDICKSQTLKNIQLQYMNLNDKFLEAFTKVLKNSPLKSVDLSFNLMKKKETIINFFQEVTTSRKIKTLSLRQLYRTFQFMEADQNQLAAAHVLTTRVRDYLRKKKGVDNEEAQSREVEEAIQRYLDKNKCLKQLDMTQNKISYLYNLYPWRSIYY